ncbi:MAG TPA: response regulator [Kofleriaceae bacterium]|nr:response regulator [Kofleriaceae bacterium]
MSNHVGLIVEDDPAMAEDLAEILRSLDYELVTVDNKRDALAAVASTAFCFVLLDLHIKLDGESIRGHTEHGRSLLREIRGMYSDHTGAGYTLPIVVVSGHAREVDTAVEVMRDGADHMIQKPIRGAAVSDAVKACLERSGRATHDLCAAANARHTGTQQGLVLSIPGTRVGRRTRVTIGTRSADLPNRSLRVLLHLMLGKLTGKSVHKTELGGRDDQGFKGISELRDDLKPALADGANIIVNLYHGYYRLTDQVVIGPCDIASLLAVDEAPITELARELERLLAGAAPRASGGPPTV